MGYFTNGNAVMNKHFKGEFKSPAKSLRDNISQWCSNNIETSGVATVIGVGDYPSDRLVDVQPLTMNRDNDGVITVPAPIYKCPVVLQGSAEGFISFPLKVGDKVLVGYPKRSIEEFVFSPSSETYDPVDRILFGSAQAVVLGYLAQAGGVDMSLSADDFEIRFKDARVTLKDDSTITLTNPNVTFEASPDGSVGLTNGVVTFIMNTDGTWSITGTADGTVNGATITVGGNVITAGGTDLDKLKADFEALVVSYNAHGAGLANHNPPVPPYVPT